MKNPVRDLLLARHAACAPQLDLRREAALADVQPIVASQLLPALFYPHRRLWLGLAAAWVVILAVHFTQRPAVHPARPTTTLYAANWSANQAQLHALLAEASSNR